MHGSSLLQPRGLGGFGFCLGLRGTRLGCRFVSKRFPSFDLGCLETGVLTNLFRLPVAAADPCLAGQHNQGDQKNCCYCCDHNPDNSGGTHSELLG